MNPVHGVSDILEHALVGHEQVAIFEASLAAAQRIHTMLKPGSRGS